MDGLEDDAFPFGAKGLFSRGELLLSGRVQGTSNSFRVKKSSKWGQINKAKIHQQCQFIEGGEFKIYTSPNLMKSFHPFHFLSACNFYLKVSSSSDQKFKSRPQKTQLPSSRISSAKIRRDARTGSGSTSLMASKYRKPRATGIKIPSNNSTQTSTLRRGLWFGFSVFCFFGVSDPKK